MIPNISILIYVYAISFTIDICHFPFIMFPRPLFLWFLASIVHHLISMEESSCLVSHTVSAILFQTVNKDTHIMFG